MRRKSKTNVQAIAGSLARPARPAAGARRLAGRAARVAGGARPRRRQGHKREGDGAPRGASDSSGCGGAPTGIRARPRYCRSADRAGRRVVRTPDRHCDRPVETAAVEGRPAHAPSMLCTTFIVEIDHNTRPRARPRQRGVHSCGTTGFAPTAGCVALELPSLHRLLARLGPRTTIKVTRAFLSLRRQKPNLRFTFD